MNVRPDQLPSMITKTVYPVYMVSGDEPLQQMESLDLIRSFLRDEDYSEREILDVDAQFVGLLFQERAGACGARGVHREVDDRADNRGDK